MTTWLIISTLITGAIFGFALCCGCLYFLIRSDEKQMEAVQKARRARVDKNMETIQHYSYDK